MGIFTDAVDKQRQFTESDETDTLIHVQVRISHKLVSEMKKSGVSRSKIVAQGVRMYLDKLKELGL